MDQFFVPLEVRAEPQHFRCFAKAPTVVATNEHTDLPLHVQYPPVAHLSWKKADEIVMAAASRAEEHIWWTFSKFYREVQAADWLRSARDISLDVDPARGSALLPGDIERLLEANFATRVGRIDEVDKNAVFIACRIFSVVEWLKRRRRVIAWPRALNAAERKILADLKRKHVTVPFTTLATLRRRTLKRYAAHLDLTKFFQQFVLLTGDYFAFVHNDVVYRLTTVPTGAVGPPLLAQVLLRAIMCYAIRSVGTGHCVVFDVMIDNARLCSDDSDALQATWSETMNVLFYIGCTVGDQMAPNELPQYEFLGIASDHASRSVSLTEKMLHKIYDGVDMLRNRAKDALIIDCLALFGTTVWIAQVLDRPLAELYYVVKFIRRISKRATAHGYLAAAPVWPSIIKLWITWLCAAIDQPSRIVETNNSLQRITCYTDASDNGWGAVIFDELGMSVLAGQWSDNEAALSINKKELLAVWHTLKRYNVPTPLEAGPRAMSLYIDNTTALSHVSKRVASNYISSSAIVEIEELRRAKGIVFDHFEYVRSASNPADAPSRLAQTTSS